MPELLSGESIGPWKVERTLTYGEPAWVAAHGDGVDAVLQVSKLHRMGQTWQDRAVAALQSLDHGAIPRLVDAGRANALLYVAMRPFPTDTLADRLFTGPVPVDLCCTWLHAVASALRHMHDAGWVHGDVAPQHIHVADDGRAWLYGMASAQRVGEAPRFTEELPARTLTHLAPEVLADPHHAPPRADIYAFGTVAYELLAGRPAFPAAAWAGRPDQQRMLLEWKTRARELDPGPPAPDWLRALVRKCTHPDAQQRLPDFDAVVAWLDASRPSWELVAPEATPMLAERRGEPPPLRVQPSLVDTESLARAIADQVHIRDAPAPRADLYVLIGAAAGLAAGLALSLLVIAYVELSRWA